MTQQDTINLMKNLRSMNLYRRRPILYITMCSHIGGQAASVPEDKSENVMPAQSALPNRVAAGSKASLRFSDETILNKTIISILLLIILTVAQRTESRGNNNTITSTSLLIGTIII